MNIDLNEFMQHILKLSSIDGRMPKMYNSFENWCAGFELYERLNH